MSTWPLNWRELMLGYNRIHGTKYADVKQFITRESAKHTNDGFADLLGVSRASINRIKKKLKITHHQLGHVTKKSKVLELAKTGKTKGMTIFQISESIGYMRITSVYPVIKDHGIEFKRL